MAISILRKIWKGYNMNHLIYHKINDALLNKEQLWVATVIENTGSIPGKTGMKMTVDHQGGICGTIGGGILENRVIKRILIDKPIVSVIWEYELNEDFNAESGMICGGSLKFLIEPVHTGTSLFIFGAGHCGMALSKLASECGFLVTVFDERPEWSNQEKHPLAFKTLTGDFNHIFEKIPKSQNDFYIIMTQGHKHDETVLKQLIVEDLGYIGMLGSKQKVTISFNILENEGINPELFKKVHAPVGVPIGSHEPMEIAVSIMAELIKTKNQK